MGGPEMAPHMFGAPRRSRGAPLSRGAPRSCNHRLMTSLTPHGEPPRYFTFPALTAAGLPHASTTRHCPGVTSPSEPTSPFTPGARETLAAAGLDLSRVAYARQVHGADVAHAITRGGVAGAVDVLSTTARGMPLAVFTADCLAITLWDAEAGALALAHVGWRGTAKRAPQAAVTAATALGARSA